MYFLRCMEKTHEWKKTSCLDGGDVSTAQLHTNAAYRMDKRFRSAKDRPVQKWAPPTLAIEPG